MECHRWLLLAATLAVVGCSASDPSNAAEGGPSDDASSGVDAAIACPSRSGYFACGTDLCSRGIQACATGLCEWYGEIEPSCGPCLTCDCLRASPMDLSMCTDDGAGGITFALWAGVEGDPCKADENCANAACLNGFCHCMPAGASQPGVANGCCSGWEQEGVCTAQAGSGCTTRVPDCNGGTCTAGTCTCVGSGGYCNFDTDCCAGTTRCVQGMCQ